MEFKTPGHVANKDDWNKFLMATKVSVMINYANLGQIEHNSEFTRIPTIWFWIVIGMLLKRLLRKTQ